MKTPYHTEDKTEADAQQRIEAAVDGAGYGELCDLLKLHGTVTRTLLDQPKVGAAQIEIRQRNRIALVGSIDSERP